LSDASSEDWFAAPEPSPSPAPVETQPKPSRAPKRVENQPRALTVLLRALTEDRLPHGILFYGDDFDSVTRAAHALAAEILQTDDAEKHADFFALRPSGKARFIRVDPMRAFIRNLYLSPNQGLRKVGIVYEADRMMDPAANAFLKTLEEPPADTTLFLLTTRPHDFLPTIHSRCFHFRIPAEGEAQDAPEWADWKRDLTGWLESLDAVAQGHQKADPAATVLPVYALSGRLAGLTEILAETRWEETKSRLPDGMDEEEQEALEEGVRKGVRSHLLLGLEQALRDFAVKGRAPNADRAQRLTDTVRELERARGLLEINVGEAAALEHVLLTALRAWTRAGER